MVTNLAEDIVCFHHCVIHQNSGRMVVTEQCRAAKGISNLGHLYTTNFSGTKGLWQVWDRAHLGSITLSLCSREASLCRVNSWDLGSIREAAEQHHTWAKKHNFSARLNGLRVQSSSSSDVCLNRGSYGCLFLQRVFNSKVKNLLLFSV